MPHVSKQVDNERATGWSYVNNYKTTSSDKRSVKYTLTQVPPHWNKPVNIFKAQNT